MVRRTRGFGLIIESDLILPGAMECATVGAPADIVISAGDATIADAAAELGPYRMAGEAIEFTAAGVGRYLIAGGRRIIVEAERDGDAAMLTALLIATALPAALWQRGDMAIHACALVPPGATQAIAVTAASGDGKSTLLSHWVDAGAAAVADDVVRLTGPAPVASGLPGGCFLPLPGGSDRAFLPFPPGRQRAQAPLAALVELVRTESETRLERLSVPDAFALLLAARHRPKVPTLLGRNGPLLATYGLLARQLPMYRLAIARGRPEAAVEQLVALAMIDTTETAK